MQRALFAVVSLAEAACAAAFAHLAVGDHLLHALLGRLARPVHRLRQPQRIDPRRHQLLGHSFRVPADLLRDEELLTRDRDDEKTDGERVYRVIDDSADTLTSAQPQAA